MESIPNQNYKESVKGFHFKEIEEIEKPMISLFFKMKKKIEDGEYDLLISDDIGGRIPTLIFREVIKIINPDKNIKTSFVSGGYGMPKESDTEGNLELKDYLSSITKGIKKALVVTQYIHTGKTLLNLATLLKKSGFYNFDMVSVDSATHFEYEEDLKKTLNNNGFYVGGDDWRHIQEDHERLSGVRKTKDYSPFPKKNLDVSKKEGRMLTQKEWKEIFGLETGDSVEVMMEKLMDPDKNEIHDQEVNRELTPDEIKSIQENVNNAREDVKLLADKIVLMVWGSNFSKIS